ncbi:MAG: MBL fold metallo-hydrolase [Armatimonadota bacterium]|nr:MBL fold metallo-hydrolase [Armatimonadota bacterium]MDR7452899.1 MBL fold metallo-hydrolase [Armatimonadota bacterium]MDR7456209.1 MBL fold metallo-hydrolase [Armatimonadota bacterium]MDR7497969.1 MBL fold metallo-hydrolase [Armatimonadota bacterium]MDR7512783.1 MBL fold metallo-hydrolase [Armatimonadota bacterium]
MAHVQRLADDLFLIDTRYNETPQAIGVFLLTGARPALIETGPGARVHTVLEGIRRAGLDPAALQAVAVTHIHLDHAAATGELLRRFPHLEVYVHPVGAPHLADPDRLLASARRLYGDALERLFGQVIPVPADRLRTLADGARVRLGDRTLTALDTPGHARHHLVYHDEASGDMFTGDAAGVALPGARYVRPPTPPPEIDLPAWDATIARLRALRPRRLLLTHFGPHEWADDLLVQLRDRLHALAGVVERALAEGLDEDAVVARVQGWLLDDIRAHHGAEAAGRFEVIMSTRLSVLGLIRYVRRG